MVPTAAVLRTTVALSLLTSGAWGAAMLNAEYWAYLRNRKPGESAFGNDE